MLAGPTTLPAREISSTGCLGCSMGHVCSRSLTRTCARSLCRQALKTCAKANPTNFQGSDLRKQRYGPNASVLVWLYLTWGSKRLAWLSEPFTAMCPDQPYSVTDV